MKKVLATLLAVAMLLSLASVSVFAADKIAIESIICKREPDAAHPLTAAFDGDESTWYWTNGWGPDFEKDNGQWNPLSSPIDIVLSTPADLETLVITWACAKDGQTAWDGEVGHRYRCNNYTVWVSTSAEGEDFVEVENVGTVQTAKEVDVFEAFRGTTRTGNVDSHDLSGQKAIRRIRLAVPSMSEYKNMGNRLSIAEITVNGTAVEGVVEEPVSSEAPVESTEAPAESVEAPVESAEAPAESVEAPVESTEAPAESVDNTEPAASNNWIIWVVIAAAAVVAVVVVVIVASKKKSK